MGIDFFDTLVIRLALMHYAEYLHSDCMLPEFVVSEVYEGVCDLLSRLDALVKD